MYQPLLRGTPASATATHATAAVATISAVSGKRHFVTDISASSDKAGSILLVKQGTTTLWQVQVGAGNYEHTFSSPLAGASGATVSVEIDGTAACKANISAYTV